VVREDSEFPILDASRGTLPMKGKGSGDIYRAKGERNETFKEFEQFD